MYTLKTLFYSVYEDESTRAIGSRSVDEGANEKKLSFCLLKRTFKIIFKIKTIYLTLI